MKIEDEIKQKHFANEFVKAHINIVFTASWLTSNASQYLKPLGLSVHQFNILRILRGMHPSPGCIKELTDRMVDKSSNASRLVDKLIAKDFVVKSKSSMDSRRVEVIISKEGLEVLESASELMNAFAEAFSIHLTEHEAKSLNMLLDKIRG